MWLKKQVGYLMSVIWSNIVPLLKCWDQITACMGPKNNFLTMSLYISLALIAN